MGSSPEFSRLLGQHICGVPGTERNAKVRVSAPEAWNSPGLVDFTGLSLHLFTFLALKARQFSGKQDTKWSMNPVPMILQAILLLMCMKYVQNLLLSLKSQGELVSACTAEACPELSLHK